MINITPTANYYNTNFKARTDYGKIYKEMEKISLRQEEKIIPKVKIRDRFADKKDAWNDRMEDVKDWWHDKWSNFKFNFMLHVFLPMLVSIGAISIGGLGYLTILAFKDIQYPDEPFITAVEKNDVSNNKQKPDFEQKVIATADSLKALLNDSTISFDEYRQKMNEAIEEYDVKSHIQLLNQKGIYSDKTEIKDLKQKYNHDHKGRLLFVCSKHGLERINIGCSKIDAKVKEFKERVKLLNPNPDEVLEEDMSQIQKLEPYVEKRANYLEKQLLETKIDFKGYEKAMEKLIEEYDVYAHLQLFYQNGFGTRDTDIQKIKQQYTHDNNGHLIAIDPYHKRMLTTDIDCSKVDKNIELLNYKLDYYKSKEANNTTVIELE